MSLHMCMGTYVHICVWKPKFDITNLPCSLAGLRSGDLVSFFCTCISSFDRSIYWGDCHFSNICSRSTCQWLTVLYYALLITIALWYVLKSHIMTPPTSFFLYNTALYILNHVSFHKNFAVVFSSSIENVIGILMETTLSLWTDKGIVAFQSLSRSCLSVLCDSMISMFLEAPVWWWCEFYHLCLSEDIFFLFFNFKGKHCWV